jgi:hypothetical protein
MEISFGTGEAVPETARIPKIRAATPCGWESAGEAYYSKGYGELPDAKIRPETETPLSA